MEKDNGFWKEQSKRFDDAADYYDRFRPGYPEKLVDCIIDKTGIGPGSKILEIGAGSGKATESFVNRGFDMYCVEPGANLAALGEKKFNHTGSVKYFISRFEDFNADPQIFDLAISAQAFHWVPKPIGFEKCAYALKDNRYMGLFWNMYLTTSRQVDDELLEVSRRYDSMLFNLNTEEECQELIGYRADEITRSGYFRKPEVYTFPWSRAYTPEEYIGFISTGNGYLSLSPRDREIVDKEATEIIVRNGGFVERPYLCALYLAQKL